MLWLDDISRDALRNRRVLLRLDLNVPVLHGAVQDDFRIRRTVPTVKKLLDSGTQLIILSHFGKEKESLAPVAKYLEQFFPVLFVSNLATIPPSTKWPMGVAVVLENLRQNAGEEMNSSDFSSQIAAQGDIFVNEAFSVSHRAHASIIGLPNLLPSYAGSGFAEEVKQLSQLFQPEKPLAVIVGGVKFGTKLPLVRKFLNIADKIFVGGALAHNFFKLKGYEIGLSVWDDSVRDLDDLLMDERVILPSEVLVRQNDYVGVTTPDKVQADGMIVDAGPAVLGQLAELVNDSQTILWNGPLGNYEDGYADATLDLARLLAGHGARVVIGGGDTIAAVEKLNLFDRFRFVSTGGGAMLDFLAEATLPGIKALEESAKKFGVGF
ncbi:phosphoglycerate kinase [Candidatus Nomurabacteria bacterium]|nr:phosphoglycerate kinase [Candidatus Nomurabacteria bacterium]